MSVYITGMIISFIIFWFCIKYTMIKDKNTYSDVNYKRLIIGTIFYPVIWLDIIIELILEYFMN